MYCPKCKRLIEDNSIYCEYCGHKIKKSKWPLIAALIGAAIIILIVLIVSISPESRAKDDHSRVFSIGDVSFTMKKVDGGNFTIGANFSSYESIH